MRQDRGQWGSTVGFVLAAAGSAIGLGNIWRFPYVTGTNGGAAFVIIYLVCVLFICLPYLMAELVLGRHTKKNPVGAILAIKKRTPWALVGGLGVLTGVFILSYYAVIAGWAFGYIFKSAIAPALPHSEFAASPLITIPLFAIFIVLTALVVSGGVEHGIERWAKILMPILLVLMFVVIIRGVTLPGAKAGLEFFLKPDFSVVDGKVILAALGQAFFSLSLGMGAIITYGSYLPKSTNLCVAGSSVALFDTVIALLAGFMIFPAVFVLFFILMSIAALTSTVSLLEVVVSYFVDERRWTRKTSVWVVGALAFVIGLPSALSQGANETLSTVSLFGNTSFLFITDFLWGNLSLAVGALLLCIFVGWVWGMSKANQELCQGSAVGRGVVFVWGLFIRWVCPIVILVVLLNLFGVFGE
jgi:NSS family neurotransmitter:Na+ symporter